ncbi:transposase [Nonomuraea sp. MG754425]|uniref:transposase n=1 Tax=Nonomuraea sp. MG754425 TaxID=2570319 RepID=UPI001F2D1B82|nr:transposase [Nonomuraea sp. MG754425]MCF6471295.1 transposase [Nonomuraea sp. MG754425]
MYDGRPAIFGSVSVWGTLNETRPAIGLRLIARPGVLGPDARTRLQQLAYQRQPRDEHRRVLFPSQAFADMYAPVNGRPSVPPGLLATVVVLQALHGLSDEEAVAALRFDLRWKAACGVGLYDQGFDPSLLTYFRRRLARSARPDRVFEIVREVIEQTGVLAGRNRRVLDSAVLLDAVATQDTITQLIAAIRRVARLVPGAGRAGGGALPCPQL